MILNCLMSRCLQTGSNNTPKVHVIHSARAVVDCFSTMNTDEDIILTTPNILPIVISVKSLSNRDLIDVCAISNSTEISKVLNFAKRRGIYIIRSYDETYNRLDHLIDKEIIKANMYVFSFEFFDGLANSKIKFTRGGICQSILYYAGALKNQIQSKLIDKKLDISALRLQDFTKVKIIKFNTGRIGYSYPRLHTIVASTFRTKPKTLMSILPKSIVIMMPLRNTNTKEMYINFIFELIEENFFSTFEKVYLKFHPRYTGRIPIFDNLKLHIIDKSLPIEFIDLNMATVLMHHSSSDLNRAGRVVNLSDLDSATFKKSFTNINVFTEQVADHLND